MKPLNETIAWLLLTVNFTSSVEMLQMITCIDPIIFRGLKSITMENTQQQSLLRLAAEGVSVSHQIFCKFATKTQPGLQSSHGIGLRARRAW